MALVTAKVFLVDMGGLTGLWRVLSFLGLGLTLIGLGSLYGRVRVQAGRTAVGSLTAIQNADRRKPGVYH